MQKRNEEQSMNTIIAYRFVSCCVTGNTGMYPKRGRYIFISNTSATMVF